MEYSCKNRSLQWIIKQEKSGRIKLTHKLQRKEGQWKKPQKAELIDSLLRDYPINPIYTVNEEGILAVIDGIQRISTIRDFLNDKFMLSKELEPINIQRTIDGESVDTMYEIAGKKFSKLDEEIQDIFLACELQIYTISEYTEKDIREMFRRQNAGKPLTSGQLRVAKESDELSDVVYSLITHPFFEEILTKAQLQKDLDKDIIREILMLTEADDGYEFGSFRSKDIDAFVEYYNDHIDTDKTNAIKDALDTLHQEFPDGIKIKQTSIPMICYGMYKIMRENKDTNAYIAWVHDFLDNYETNEEYVQYCRSGSANAENVKGRLDYFISAIDKI